MKILIPVLIAGLLYVGLFSFVWWFVVYSMTLGRDFSHWGLGVKITWAIGEVILLVLVAWGGVEVYKEFKGYLN